MSSVLRFQSDGRFTIVQFTDLHWRNGDDVDRRTRAVMECALDTEHPDLVVLTGDVISGEECADPAESWRQAVRPIEARRIPWAAVFGNHDDEGSLSRSDLMTVQASFDHCVSERGPADVTGVGNYVLPVFAAGTDTLGAALYCVDSGAYAPEPVGGYAWIAEDQIAWTLAESRRLRVPALAFFHIPLPEYNDVWERDRCRGVKQEPVCCPRVNSGFFAALCEAGDVLGAFAGHDHLNDYEGMLDGVRLCYGRVTGHAGYGRADFLRGARVIRLEAGVRTFTTWLRLEDGTAVGGL